MIQRISCGEGIRMKLIIRSNIFKTMHKILRDQKSECDKMNTVLLDNKCIKHLGMQRQGLILFLAKSSKHRQVSGRKLEY